MCKITSISDFNNKRKHDKRYELALICGYKIVCSPSETETANFEIAFDWMNKWLKENVRDNSFTSYTCKPMVDHINKYIDEVCNKYPNPIPVDQ